MGRRWYDDGKLEHKQHTFDDFIACARHLVAAGWTTADRLVAEGGSAGGLLIGAVANQAPEAFAGIVAAGAVRRHADLDARRRRLPLTVTEYDEWGNPAADPATYDRIAAYAPYENVADLRLPADPRRDLAQRHPGALRRAGQVGGPAARARAGGADVLLRTEMAAGHGGVSGRYRAWQDRAFSSPGSSTGSACAGPHACATLTGDSAVPEISLRLARRQLSRAPLVIGYKVRGTRGSGIRSHRTL